MKRGVNVFIFLLVIIFSISFVLGDAALDFTGTYMTKSETGEGYEIGEMVDIRFSNIGDQEIGPFSIEITSLESGEVVFEIFSTAIVSPNSSALVFPWYQEDNNGVQVESGRYNVHLDSDILKSSQWLTINAESSDSSQSECDDNSCTLYEGETITHNGHSFSISFISSSGVILNVDGTDTKELSGGESQTIDNLTTNLTIKIPPGGIDYYDGIVKFTFTVKDLKSRCEGNSCTLYFGEKITHNGHDFLLSFTSSTMVILNVDGKDTNTLQEGESEVVGDINIYIRNIGYYDGTVKFTFKLVVVDIPEDNETYVCQGCELEEKCYPLGYRKSGEFCSDTLEFVAQSKAGETCDNSFECDSNVCVSGECVSKSLIQKIIDFFRRLFGGS
jgi:hypothetical protein